MTSDAGVGKPELSVLGDTYRIAWPSGIVAELERFSEHRDELTAEVTIRSDRPPRPGLLHSARFNLMSTQARKTLCGALAQRDPELDWGAIVEALCFLARERYRAGDPTIDLRSHERSQTARWLIEPFLEHGGPTTIAAHGGSGKTRSVLAIAVTLATGVPIIGRLHGDPCPVMVLDWETDADTWLESLDAVLAGAEIAARPPIYYRRMVASLPESAPTIRREVSRLRVGAVIVDSLGMARGGEPESADMTLRVFAAARSLEVPVLFTDHVTNAAADDAKRPFGSAYTWNSSRLVWTIDKVQEEGNNALALAFVNRKWNNGRILPRQGYRIEFDNGAQDQLLAIRFRRIDVAATPGLAEKLPLRQRILAELRGGPIAVDALVSELGVDEKQLGSRVGEMVRRGELVRLEDRRVALAARESA